MSDSAKNIILALFIFLLPPMAIFYLIFSKSKLWDNPWVKTMSLSWCLAFILFAFFTPHQRQSTDNKQSIESSQAEIENEGDTKTEITNNTGSTDENNAEATSANDTPTATQAPTTTTEPAPEPPAPEAASTTTSTPTPTPTPVPQTSQEDPSLPLKAICGNGTVQYQDTPSHTNYQGMCSHHNGVVQKLGRVP